MSNLSLFILFFFCGLLPSLTMGQTEICEGEDILYENGEGDTFFVPKDSMITRGTFVFVDDEDENPYVGWMAFVNENCEIDTISTKVFCADSTLAVPFLEFEGNGVVGSDPPPRVSKIHTYAADTIGLTDLEATRLEYLFCNQDDLCSGGCSDEAIQNAIWGILGQADCDSLCSAAQEAVPDDAGIEGLAGQFVTYRHVAPEDNIAYQDFIALLPQDSCSSCTLTAVITVDQNVGCKSEATGALTATASEGNPPYSYLWSNDATTPAITDLVAGTYTVTITDDAGCTATATAAVSEPAEELTIALTGMGTSGSSDSTGTASATVTGGTMPYTYAWSTGDSTESITGLPAGTYGLTVTDENACTAVDSITLEVEVNLELTTTITDVLCAGDSTGSVTVTVAGGSTPYQYLWNTGDTTEMVENLPAGIYAVTVTDANEVTAVDSAVVSVQNPILIDIAAAGFSCAGDSTGTLIASVIGGAEPYQFAWNTGDTTATVENLPLGTYTVTVTDANSCTVTDSIDVAASILELTMTATDIVAGVDTAGSVGVMVMGGTPPYGYLWNTGDSTETVENLPVGNYIVTVTDSTGCTAVDSIMINEVTAGDLMLSLSVTDILCAGDSTGVVETAVSGGTMPYRYLWNTGDSTATITDLPAGIYAITVTDSLGLTAADTVNLQAPEPIALTLEATSTGGSGSIDLSVTGGTPPFSFLWSNGAETEDVMDLAAGTYQVTVTDANGCTAVDSTEISAVDCDLKARINVMTMKNCQQIIVGMADARAWGGTPPYTYLWSTGDTVAVLNELPGGEYSLTVTDANGCEAVDDAYFEIEQPEYRGGLIEYDQVLCGSDNDPEELYHVSYPMVPGEEPEPHEFIFKWMKSTTPCDDNFRLFGHKWEEIPGAKGESYDPGPLTETTYFVRWAFWKGNLDLIFSSNVILIEVIDAEAPTIDAGDDIIACAGDSVLLTANVSGGAPDYSFDWTNYPVDNDSLNVLPMGTTDYRVTVTDANGCTAIDTVQVKIQPGGPSIRLNVLSNNAYFCPDDTVDLSVSLDGVPTATWETDGDGMLDTLQGISNTYTFGSEDITNGIVTISATTAEYEGDCPLKSDQVELLVFADSSSVCQGGAMDEGEDLHDPDYETEMDESMINDSWQEDPELNPQPEKEERKEERPAQKGWKSYFVSDSLQLYQNKPNPFMYSTVIGFEIPSAGLVTMRILDMSGKTVKSFEMEGRKGYNEVEVTRDGLPYGLHYVVLEKGGYRLIRKMVVLE